MNRRLIIAVAAIASIAVLAGCSQKYSAERDGKKLGEAICDLRSATTREEADDALEEINDQLDDLSTKFAVFTAEDRADVQNNLADLAEHTIQGNDVLAQQDLAVLERSADNIADDSNEVRSAAWEGLLQGLAECTQN
ncbi:MAG: hypothetical protein V9E94_21360 [Microthrixaceae bacterium]